MIAGRRADEPDLAPDRRDRRVAPEWRVQIDRQPAVKSVTAKAALAPPHLARFETCLNREASNGHTSVIDLVPSRLCRIVERL